MYTLNPRTELLNKSKHRPQNHTPTTPDAPNGERSRFNRTHGRRAPFKIRSSEKLSPLAYKYRLWEHNFRMRGRRGTTTDTRDLHLQRSRLGKKMRALAESRDNGPPNPKSQSSKGEVTP